MRDLTAPIAHMIIRCLFMRFCFAFGFAPCVATASSNTGGLGRGQRARAQTCGGWAPFGNGGAPSATSGPGCRAGSPARAPMSSLPRVRGRQPHARARHLKAQHQPDGGDCARCTFAQCPCQ